MTQVDYTDEQFQGYLESVSCSARLYRVDGAVEYFNSRMLVAIRYPNGDLWVDFNV